MLLEDFIPQSELIVKETYIEKPRFPVYDSHSHWGRLLLGDDYPSAYNTKEVVESLKECGLAGICNVDGFWGDELDKSQVVAAHNPAQFFGFFKRQIHHQ